MTTPFHSQYWATELTLRAPTGSIESISRSIAGARVDLNPHQIEAALFALRSPLMKGAILADEVGLGKTIEAGIVIAQRWAERKRRILLIVPATLRKQWQQEMESKFYLSAIIIDSKVFNDFVGEGQINPFDIGNKIAICSYHFASAKSQEISRIPWDLVVIDEAHRLRNIFRNSSKLARSVVDAIGRAPKLLVTATPLQNSLMELYGLASVIDDHIFGDAASFRDQFVRAADEKRRNADLRDRLLPICARTLRKQVVEYIPFTRRVPVTQDFRPGDDEHALYETMTAYLQRDDLIALPASQRTLITLVLRKLLASSTFAIANTIDRLIKRLEDISSLQQLLLDDEDVEDLDELQDEMQEQEEEEEDNDQDLQTQSTAIDPEKLKSELTELRRFVEMARRITVNAKGEALIPALKVAFERAERLGAQRKAVIFTESRRTQQYLFDLLSSQGYKDQLAMINGSNNDPYSGEIYKQWQKRHEGQDVSIGSRPVDIKAAIVEHFRDFATILIATEAAAEGVNLQFCSLVVNYDLPWNPQRIEQRIGRCHRYGQKHDVVVVNFLNRRNEADRRVLELLSEKFRLFDGVFGASDEILGALESGVDIERRIAQVYQTCRNADEIKAAFDKLQGELEEQIQIRMAQTREVLLENFDEDVSTRLRVNRDKTLETLSNRERHLLELTRTELAGEARFDFERPRFQYLGNRAHQGWYDFDWKEAEKSGDTFYRQDHSLAVQLIEEALNRDLAPAMLELNYAAHGQMISALMPLIGSSGWFELSKLTVESLDIEEFLIFSASTDNGMQLDEELCRKLLVIPAKVENHLPSPAPDFSVIRQVDIQNRIKRVEERNGKFFDEEVLKLDRWSDDLKQGLERKIKDLDKQIREARRAAVLAASLHDKLEAQKSIKALEGTRNHKRRELFDAQDAIDSQRDELIARIEKQLQQRHSSQPVFTFRWRLI
jgi:ERCC4-related helicase